ISPSRFIRDRFIDWGIQPQRIFYIPNGHEVPSRMQSSDLTTAPKRARNRFAFFGRFVENKGLLVLFDAIKLLRNRRIDFTVDLYGGNLEHEATDQFRKAFNAFREKEQGLYLHSRANVRFNGSYEVSDLDKPMRDVDWVVVPSIWWETFGMVVSEAFLYGK